MVGLRNRTTLKLCETNENKSSKSNNAIELFDLDVQ